MPRELLFECQFAENSALEVLLCRSESFHALFMFFCLGFRLAIFVWVFIGSEKGGECSADVDPVFIEFFMHVLCLLSVFS